MAAAITPAVSVLSRLSPSVTGTKPAVSCRPAHRIKKSDPSFERRPFVAIGDKTFDRLAPSRRTGY